MHTIYIALGSNLGEKEQNLIRAIKQIEKRIGQVIAQSAFIYTSPWGYESKNRFINAAIACTTQLSPEDLLLQTQLIEKKMGRTYYHKSGYEDRIIDLDILLYDDIEFNSKSLQIPHPLMCKRLFVLEPLVQIAADVVHPTQNKTILELFNEMNL
ncbi:MAG: 2-amino-4-hydroxy-6-hydroxymethyldihydropteridine diphosphokinase [Bacteroides sp.]|nr:2-amino-4-hydroxy-6-hydroxymethyldihydropteridine diphosphokinase [Bacteroides sp.]MDD2645472.1 2-amino-4-hydroxy-6-hydroxymethyldihydropteridine diphosphokinase [Bacteroides sp.]MDD4054426.1 2-amino-4-hydroxy-6-hydroxymethyldihydropteridine diphosphokinase [Bacteroides sp.]MDD4720057.1 2-amino-4-hydroxy-6-hydroxymethyldihydropteridine diphosphokinase [Bacteroides sp.]NLI63715.1 2-amino-4-hydroxy-6-hydroxymethyldihydropteridine diphosphokinase [Bacteroidales bacterium]